MKQLAIQCKGIKKFYGSGDNKVEALKSTDLDIYTGELTLLVGPSGSGKTTLVSIMATILTPDEGELTVLGKKIDTMSEDEKALFRGDNIGFVFQSLFLIPTLTNAENVALPQIVKGMDEEASIEKGRELLDKVHLKHKSEVPPTSLSKGQQQRVAIVRAMINEAAIMICDEPTSSLDHESGYEIMDFLHSFARNSSKAVLVVTHDPRIFPYADRIINMVDGQISSEVDAHE